MNEAERKPLNVIVAVARNGVIGRDGRLPWSIPSDWRHFLRTTRGQVCLLGRRCFEEMEAAGEVDGSRTYVVLTRRAELADRARRVHVAPDLDEGLRVARALPGETWVCGGEEVYRTLLPRADRLLLTLVDADVEGDTRFPDWRGLFPVVASRSAAQDNGWRYEILDLRRG